MPRAGNGTYTLPANTAAVSGDPISSTKFNTLVQDLESDANVDRPIAAGGTGASTAQAALTNLFSGATPGSADKIAFWDHSALAFGWLGLGTGLSFNGTTLELDADLSTLAGLTVAADNFIVGNSGGTAWEVKTPSQARTSLGLGTIATQAASNVTITGGSITGITDLAVADGGTGASDAAGARTNLGLVIGTNVQAYDAGLLSIAGLTTAADKMIYTTASDTYAVTDLTSFGRSLVDDADASAARTTLGLGSLATLSTVNNGNWSGTALAIANGGTGATSAGAALTALGALAASSYTASDVLTKLLTVDGAGSGLDADTLDGDQGSAFAKLASAQTFTAQKTFSVNGAAVTVMNSDQNYFTTYQRSASIVGYTGADATNFYWFDSAGVARAQIAWATGNIAARVAASAETTGTLTVASANRTIQATGDITINNSVFAAGDIILIYAGASSRTITQGSGVTMRLGGTSTTGSRTLAARGVAVLFFVSASEVVVSGGAVT